MTAQTGAMIALIPSAADAARLAADGGEPVGELHVTVAYLGNADQLDTATRQNLIAAVTAAANGMPAVTGQVFGVAMFNPGGDEPCIVLNVGGDELDAVHHFLLDTVPLPPVGQHAPWQPHITLAYTSEIGELAKLTDRVGPVTFDRLRLAIAGDSFDVPLLPADTTTSAEDPTAAGGGDDGYAAWLDDQGALVEADTTPGDGQLKRYWLGKGLDKWATSAHPWTALYRHLRKYITNPVLLKKTVSRWYIDHFGHTPNQQRPMAESAASTQVSLTEVTFGV